MAKLSKESDALHAACMRVAAESDDPTAHQFTQSDFEKHVQCSTQELLVLINELVDHLLLRSFKLAGQMHWCIRTKDLAASLATLTEQERIVFGHVEDVASTGIWVKKIKAITQIPPNEVQKAIGKLEKMGMVKGIRSVNNPAQRIYMLSHLAPSDKITGGSFFDAGELDESMVEELCNLIIFHVRSKSWIDSKRRTRRGSSVVDLEEDDRSRKRAIESIEKEVEGANGKHKNAVFLDDNSDDETSKTTIDNKKRKLDTADIEDGMDAKPRKRRGSDVRTLQLAHPVGSADYPTVENILDFLKGCNAIRDSKADSLTTQEVQGLIDVLVWDDRLERIRNGYRTVRGVQFNPGAYYDAQEDLVGNGLTEVPCSRCQLFDLCQEGTKVSAETCVYYQEWIKI